MGLLDWNKPDNCLFIGKTLVFVENYAHQVPKEEWLELHDQNGKVNPGKLNQEVLVYVHYVHDRVKYTIFNIKIKYYEETKIKL